ncbi:MAG: hypothetical protein Kow00124_32370 [Anaerolineae bacterium]
MTEERRGFYKWVMTGFLGFALLVLVEGPLGGEITDFYLKLALYAFTFSIPPLIIGLLITDANNAKPWLIRVLISIGAVVAIVGIVALFFHFGPDVAVLFAVSLVLMLPLLIFGRKGKAKDEE